MKLFSVVSCDMNNKHKTPTIVRIVYPFGGRQKQTCKYVDMIRNTLNFIHETSLVQLGMLVLRF